jgi:hypothetical protein
MAQPKGVGSKSAGSKKHSKRRSGIFLLEQRVMYDGAAAASAGHHGDHHADHYHTNADGSPGGPGGAPMQAPAVGAPPAPSTTRAEGTGSNSGHAFASQGGDWSKSTSVASSEPMPQVATAVRNPTEIVFIDPQVPDSQTLISGAKPGVEVVVLDANSDGLQQIANFLSHHRDPNLTTIDIVAHGSQGEMLLGSTDLTDANLSADSAALAQIGRSLGPNGAILLYGCSVAGDTTGLQFISDLSKDTGGVDIVAATHNVGATALGGSWNLDIATGRVDVASPFTQAALDAFPDLLTTAPVVTGTGNFIDYSAQATAVTLDPDLVVSDVDSTTLSGATVKISSGLQSGDALHFVNQNGITGSYDAANGVLTLSGTALISDYQAALRSVTFDNPGNNPTDTGLYLSRTIDWQVNNGAPVSASPLGTATTVSVGATQAAVATADLNHDGLLDLVTVNQSANTISVQFGTGSGGFSAATSFAVGTGPRSVAIADFNGDGNLDLAVTLSACWERRCRSRLPAGRLREALSSVR